jgi:GT2 family glycosyltransferase
MNQENKKKTVSIVIPVFNKVEYTKKCIHSLLSDPCRYNYEIIVVDNGSTDDTKKYLETMKENLKNSNDTFITIYNEKNLGVAPAWNQGCKLAQNEIIAVLNNDIVVTQGWLCSLLWALETFHLELVSPFANTGELNYELEQKAFEFTEKNSTKVWLNEYDFCAFIFRKRLFQELGDFDENFLVGGYEDTDYIYRLRKNRYRFGVSGSAFIHHFGSSTLGDFKKLGDKHVGHNRDYFIQKWGEDPSIHQKKLKTKIRKIFRKLKLKFGRM